MKKNNVRNPMATLMAFMTLGMLAAAILRMIRRHHIFPKW